MHVESVSYRVTGNWIVEFQPQHTSFGRGWRVTAACLGTAVQYDWPAHKRFRPSQTNAIEFARITRRWAKDDIKVTSADAAIATGGAA